MIVGNTEISTGGACCMKKFPDHFGVECEWLFSGEKVSLPLSGGKVENKCQIVTITFDGTHLHGSAYDLDHFAQQ